MLKLNPISHLRATMGRNPEHNEHIQHIIEALDDTVMEL